MAAVSGFKKSFRRHLNQRDCPRVRYTVTDIYFKSSPYNTKLRRRIIYMQPCLCAQKSVRSTEWLVTFTHTPAH